MAFLQTHGQCIPQLGVSARGRIDAAAGISDSLPRGEYRLTVLRLGLGLGHGCPLDYWIKLCRSGLGRPARFERGNREPLPTEVPLPVAGSHVAVPRRDDEPLCSAAAPLLAQLVDHFQLLRKVSRRFEFRTEALNKPRHRRCPLADDRGVDALNAKADVVSWVRQPEGEPRLGLFSMARLSHSSPRRAGSTIASVVVVRIDFWAFVAFGKSRRGCKVSGKNRDCDLLLPVNSTLALATPPWPACASRKSVPPVPRSVSP